VFRNLVLAALAAGTLSFPAASAQTASTQSLGEVARQTADKRAAGKKATKVYSNGSLSQPQTDQSAVVSESAPAASSGDLSKAEGKPVSAEAMLPNSQDKLKRDTVEMDENYWRKEAASHRRDVEQARAAVEGYETAPPAGSEAQRRNAEKQYEQSKQMLAYYEKRRAAFLQAAQSAQVPPGWLEPKP
jgi:hypothetical protein